VERGEVRNYPLARAQGLVHIEDEMNARSPDSMPSSRSIASRIGLLIVLTSAAVSFVATAVLLHAEYAAGVAKLQSQFDWIEVSHVPALATSVWVMDPTQVDEQLQGILKLPQVERVTLRGDVPRTVSAPGRAASAGEPDGPAQLSRTYPLLYHQAGRDDIPRRVGELQVEVSLDELRSSITGTALRVFAVEMLRASVISVVLILGIRRLVTTRLSRIADYTTALRIDTLSTAKAPVLPTSERHDDIDRLAVAIEQMRLSLHDEIEKRRLVEAQSRTLMVGKEVAELANATKTEFLASMSHEIRTPMNAVIGMSSLALQGELGARERRYVEKVLSSARLLLGLINDILDYSKAEAGMMDIDRVSFNLFDLLDEVVDLIGQRSEEKQLELVFDCSPSLPTTIVADPLRLRQVLLNLCGNAVKFTQTGSVVLRVTASPADGDRTVLHFEVSDTGIGMSAVEVTQLFRPFTQADRTTTRRFGGTGLGLAISQRLVQLMGSEITVVSKVGEGSTFSFDLTVGVPHEAPRALAAPAGRTDRVLVVDDNPVSREVLARMAAHIGFETETAASGEEALGAVAVASQQGRPFLLVLLDWRMPGMNGVECARRLMDSTPHPPCILMVTGFARDAVQEQLRAAGAEVQAILTKPVTPSSLVDACSVALGLGKADTSAASDFVDIVARYRRILAGRVVLLAEDNDVNAEIATELLRQVGIRVVLAGDGAQALERLNEQAVDAVLMDCQMPVIDGLNATRTLRTDPRWRQLPVIAMTANAMVGDREQVMAAGMNDHIAKPVDVEVLYATLARWLSSPSYRRVLHLFGTQIDRFRIDIEAALALDDRVAIGALLQGLKGAAGHISAVEIVQAAESAEAAAEQGGDPQVLRERLQRLECELDTLRRAMDGVRPPP
jgi:signal transduction histidine kinase/CheY-like chemotaxis protein/HPt (histidine-containing phosphotransfer) domain-containing protein